MTPPRYRTKPARVPETKRPVRAPRPTARRRTTDGEPAGGPCFNCARPVGPMDYCFGCKVYVCTRCAVNDTLMGPHEQEDHLVDSLDEGEQ